MIRRDRDISHAPLSLLVVCTTSETVVLWLNWNTVPCAGSGRGEWQSRAAFSWSILPRLRSPNMKHLSPTALYSFIHASRSCNTNHSYNLFPCYFVFSRKCIISGSVWSFFSTETTHIKQFGASLKFLKFAKDTVFKLSSLC